MTNTWDRATTQNVADEMKRLRGPQTVQWLSDRTAALGHRIGRSRISDLERGDRGGLLGVAELLVLAAALEVPPAALLYPGLPFDDTEVVPNVHTTAWQALAWFNGEQPPNGVPTLHTANFQKNAETLTLTKALFAALRTEAAARQEFKSLLRRIVEADENNGDTAALSNLADTRHERVSSLENESERALTQLTDHLARLGRPLTLDQLQRDLADAREAGDPEKTWLS